MFFPIIGRDKYSVFVVKLFQKVSFHVYTVDLLLNLYFIYLCINIWTKIYLFFFFVCTWYIYVVTTNNNDFYKDFIQHNVYLLHQINYCIFLGLLMESVLFLLSMKKARVVAIGRSHYHSPLPIKRGIKNLWTRCYSLCRSLLINPKSVSYIVFINNATCIIQFH